MRRAEEKVRNAAVKRIEKAYPAMEARSESGSGGRLTIFDAVWMFAISSFLGDVVETIFCRAVDGVWMSRSSLVWGPFSVVWGLGLVLGSMLLGRMRKQSDGRLFISGVLLGGAYEYICSVFTEIVFGTVFWDYSEMPFNVGGRINLLYCFFWGIAVVIWIKWLYPSFLMFVRSVIKKAGGALTAAVAIFLALDIFLSCAALARYDARSRGIEAENVIEKVLDERFSDERMEKIYPNALQR
ncbi:MAG: putative ABC transporter permease [Clostridia bacterium]|nr:putative ABC transporter permease [Clostridia bacterium]